MLQIEDWRLSIDERFPIYQQIVNQFCRALIKGEMIPGDRIPSIRDMALALKVNTNTIQRSYQEMERKNLIFSQRGTGYFVMKDEKMVAGVKEDMVKDIIARFLEEMRGLGLKDVQILEELNKQMKETEEDD